MSFLGKIFGVAAKYFGYAPPTEANKLQAFETWMDNIGCQETASGKQVSYDMAMALAAVHACVKVLAESCASLPLKLYRYSNDGAEEVTDHPVAHLLKVAPNKEHTPFEFKETVVTYMALTGQACVQKVLANNGELLEIIPLNPNHMTIGRNKQGHLLFHYEDDFIKRVFKWDEIWYSRYFMGLSPIGLMREQVALNACLEESGAQMFRNGMRLSGLLEHPLKLSEEAERRLIRGFQSMYSGVKNHHKMMVLQEGMRFSKVSMTAEDAQFLESRRFSLEEIARCYRVPLSFVGDLTKAHYNNVEHQDLSFIKHSLRPWLMRNTPPNRAAAVA